MSKRIGNIEKFSQLIIGGLEIVIYSIFRGQKCLRFQDNSTMVIGYFFLSVTYRKHFYFLDFVR